MRSLALVFLLVLSVAAAAQSKRPPKLEPLPEPPPPPAMPGPDEGGVVIDAIPRGHKVEEGREGGRVVMLKVTPPGGKPYFLVDTTGNGNWIRRDSLDDGNRVPMWTIKTFD